MTIIIAGTIILAIIHDASGTATLLASTLSIRGVTWITKKITEKINLDASQIIDFAGWSIAGVSIVKIISNAMGSIDEVKIFFMKASGVFDKIASIVDKIAFWN